MDWCSLVDWDNHCICPVTFAVFLPCWVNFQASTSPGQMVFPTKVNSSQYMHGYKIKTCLSRWPNGTAKSSQLTRKPFNCLSKTMHAVSFKHSQNKVSLCFTCSLQITPSAAPGGNIQQQDNIPVPVGICGWA